MLAKASDHMAASTSASPASGRSGHVDGEGGSNNTLLFAWKLAAIILVNHHGEGESRDNRIQYPWPPRSCRREQSAYSSGAEGPTGSCVVLGPRKSGRGHRGNSRRTLGI